MSTCTLTNKWPDEVGETTLSLTHSRHIGGIIIENKIQGEKVAVMMAKGDAIILRDALNDWIEND